MDKRVFMTAGLALASAPGFAREELGVAATTSLDPAGDVGSVLLVLLAGIVLIALWSSLTRTRSDALVPTRGPAATNLFLGLRFQVLGDAARLSQTGHLRALNLRSAQLVSPRFLDKGARIRLDLGSLPDFPGGEAPLEAEVTASRVVPGDPPSYLVTVRFASLGDVARDPLARYLQHLSPGRA